MVRRRIIGGNWLGDGDPARQSEVTVEPTVEQRAAVDLDAQLLPSGHRTIGLRPGAQVGAVGVCSDDAQRGVCRLATATPGRNETLVAHHHRTFRRERSAPWALREPGGHQASGGLAGRMVGRR